MWLIPEQNPPLAKEPEAGHRPTRHKSDTSRLRTACPNPASDDQEPSRATEQAIDDNDDALTKECLYKSLHDTLKYQVTQSTTLGKASQVGNGLQLLHSCILDKILVFVVRKLSPLID